MDTLNHNMANATTSKCPCQTIQGVLPDEEATHLVKANHAYSGIIITVTSINEVLDKLVGVIDSRVGKGDVTCMQQGG